MNIIITGTGFSFPDGTGAAVRVTSFAKGLMQHGATVHIFCPKPSENERTGMRNLQLKGVYQGIPFEYTCGQRMVAKNRVGALLLYLKGLWCACRAIRRIHRETPVDAILLLYAESPINVLVFSALAKSLGALLIAEECEFPYAYSRKTTAVRIRTWFNEAVTYRMLDGAIVISAFLHDYFAVRLSKTAKLLHVPILVEAGSFLPVTGTTEGSERKIIFCGNLEHDGEVDELLRAFAQVAGDFPEWRVQVIGDTDTEARKAALETVVGQLGLADRVQFIGQRPRRDIPLLLAQGDVMALPRAAGTFSQAGFPTKLGEYLASGKPVVVTATGDIPTYLQDGVNAFLTVPGDRSAFAGALQYIMSHPKEAREVGLRGREVAVSQFDSELHSARIIAFIRTLRQGD